MTTIAPSFVDVCDRDIVVHVKDAAAHERGATGRLIALLAEFDARRLHLAEGCSSLFIYCTQVLHLSEHAAYGRIEAARAARRLPVVLERLADGSVNLTTVCLLAPHLTPQNAAEVLDRARHKSKRYVEHLVAELRPLPDVAAAVRKLPEAKAVAPSSATDPVSPAGARAPTPTVAPTPPSHRPVVAPLAPERYKIQMTVDRETYERLRRAQDLLRHVIPTGGPAAIVGRALTLLVERLERTRCATTDRPHGASPPVSSSRTIPAAVRRRVLQRDGNRCAFVGTEGRCTDTGFLEFHHVLPFADGGAGTVDNIELRCRSHDAHEAERWFGLAGP